MQNIKNVLIQTDPPDLDGFRWNVFDSERWDAALVFWRVKRNVSRWSRYKRLPTPVRRSERVLR